jgi:uncharacterized OB-fold protein
MALTKCKACGKEYYSGAVKCPDCGTPSRIGNIQSVGYALFAIGAIITAIVFALLWCGK